MPADGLADREKMVHFSVEFEILGRQELHPDLQICQIGSEVLLRFVRQ
jgi:hypothetical protein